VPFAVEVPRGSDSSVARVTRVDNAARDGVPDTDNSGLSSQYSG
jgi:hypothetical protein